MSGTTSILIRNTCSPGLKRPPGRLVTNSTSHYLVSVANEGYACRVCVDGIDVAQHILNCLSVAFVFKTCEPFRKGPQPTQCIFRVAYGSQLTHQSIERLLTAIPGVRLRSDPLSGKVN